MNEIPYMPITTFRERGYVHEINRLVLHPLGLALSVSVFEEPAMRLWLREQDVALLETLAKKIGDALKDDLSDQERQALADLLARIREAEAFEAGDAALDGIWDGQADPEGWIFGNDLLSPEKAKAVCAEFFERRAERLKRLGYVIQPIPEAKVLTLNYLDPDSKPVKVKVNPDVEFEQ